MLLADSFNSFFFHRLSVGRSIDWRLTAVALSSQIMWPSVVCFTSLWRNMCSTAYQMRVTCTQHSLIFVLQVLKINSAIENHDNISLHKKLCCYKIYIVTALLPSYRIW